jgi:hypothetical protein
MGNPRYDWVALLSLVLLILILILVLGDVHFD